MAFASPGYRLFMNVEWMTSEYLARK